MTHRVTGEVIVLVLQIIAFHVYLDNNLQLPDA